MTKDCILSGNRSMRQTRFRAAVAFGGLAFLSLGITFWWTIDRVGLERLATIHLPAQAFRVVLSLQSGKVAFINRTGAWICDLATGTPIASLKNPVGHSLGTVAISSSANKVAVTDGEGTLSVFSLTDGSPLWSQHVTHLQFCDVRFFPSGTRIVVSDGIWFEPEDNGGAIRIYDAEDGSLKTTVIPYRTHSPMELAISPDERWLCARFNYGGEVVVWNLPEIREVRRFGFCNRAHGHVKDPNTTSLNISHDGKFISVGGEGAFGIWRLETGEQLLAVVAEDKSFNVKFHPSEALLYAATSDAVEVWKFDGEHFVKQSTTPVRLKDRRYTFADDAPILCVQENQSLTLYRLPAP